MKVVLTNNQLCVLKEAMTARFTVREVTITFKHLNEDWYDKYWHTEYLHRRLAMYIASEVFNLGPKSVMKGSNNPFKREDDSYYFPILFEVDGVKVPGEIRVSNHVCHPGTFAGRNVQYGLSIVIDNHEARPSLGGRPIQAKVYEYITASVDDSTRNSLERIARMLKISKDVEIKDNHVAWPSAPGVDFKLVTKLSRSQGDVINLYTNEPGDVARFHTQDHRIVVTARETINGYKILPQYREKFKLGDELHFFCGSTEIRPPQKI